MTVTSFWLSEHGPTSSLHNSPGNDRSSPLRVLWRRAFSVASAKREAWGSRPNVNLICCARGWCTALAIQMAKPPDPRVPHPSFLPHDLFFLAGDLDTLHSLAEVRESRNQYCLPSCPTLPLSFSLSQTLNSILQIYCRGVEEETVWCGCIIYRITPQRITKEEVFILMF